MVIVEEGLAELFELGRRHSSMSETGCTRFGMTARRQFFIEKLKASKSDIDYMDLIDPSGKRWMWLLRGRREGWLSSVSIPEIQEALTRFNKLSKSPRFSEAKHHADLNVYTWETLGRVLEMESELKSNKQRAREFEGCELMWSEDECAVYKVLTPTGAELAGSGSSWCTTANHDIAAGYLRNGPLYIARIWDQPYAQISPARLEWNLAANLVTKQTIFDTTVWLDSTGHALFMKAARAKNDSGLIKALNRHPVIKINVAGDTALSAILNPTVRISSVAERELIKKNQLPKGYFRRFRRNRDLEIEALLGSRAPADVCMDYVECVSNNVSDKLIQRIEKNDGCMARYISRSGQSTTYEFTSSRLGLFRAWMALELDHINHSAVKLLGYVELRSALDYLKRCNLTAPRLHKQLVSRKSENLNHLIKYEIEILGTLLPRTIETLKKLGEESRQGLRTLSLNNQQTIAKAWRSQPELRGIIPIIGLEGVRVALEDARTRLPEVEEVALHLTEQDLDYREFRQYIGEVAEPILSDAFVLKAMTRREGCSTSGGSLDGYLRRYPKGPEKRAFATKLLEGGLSYRNDNVVHRAMNSGVLLSRDIVFALTNRRKLNPNLWSYLISQVGTSRALSFAAMRLYKMGAYPTFDWSVCIGWRVSPYVQKFFASLPATEPSLIWLAVQGQLCGFEPSEHPDLVHFQNYGLNVQAETYARTTVPHLVMPAHSDHIEWLGWGTYTKKDTRWFKS